MDVTWHPRGVTFGMSHVVHLCGGKKRKENKKNKEKCEDDKWQRRKVLGSFPHFDQFRYENQKGEGGKGKWRKRGEENGYREEEKGRKENGDFAGVPMVEARRSEN